MPKLEILAPAGDMTALKTVVHNGADAVYLGLGDFNARVKAQNFDLTTLKQGLDFAHLHNVRVYVACNTLVLDSELPRVVDMIGKASSLGVDAFIVQDLGLVAALNRQGIAVELHASTQAGVHNLEGAQFFEELGFRRVILSRETTLGDIQKIRNHTNLEIESFVHGALCVAFSGNCYFSSLITGESGNRGRCLQFCRKPYKLSGGGKSTKEGYFLSPKDLNLSQRMKELAAAGVTSFKIEGRLRRAEYAGLAVAAYKRALEGCSLPCDQSDFRVMFNRGNFCEGYAWGNDERIISSAHPAHIGEKIGTVQRVGKTADMRIHHDSYTLHKGDGIKFMRGGIESGSARVTNPQAITFAGNVQTGDEVRLTTSTTLNERVLKARRQIPLSLTVRIQTGECVSLGLTDGNIGVTTQGEDLVEIAKTAPLTKENLDFLSKTGDESLVMSDITLDLGENCFVSVAELKALKRKLVDNWKQARLEAYCKHQISLPNIDIDSVFRSRNWLNIPSKQLFVMVKDSNALTEELISRADYVVLSPEKFSLSDAKAFCDRAKEKAVLNLPIVARGKDMDVLRRIVDDSGIGIYIVNNPYGLSLCRNHTLIAGIGMNLLNTSLDGVTHLASIESVRARRNCIHYVYGFVPLMTLTHCPRQNLLGERCGSCGNKDLWLDDGRGSRFFYRRKQIATCYFELLNGIPLDNREVLGYQDCSALIDLTYEQNPSARLTEILTTPHASQPHMHGNYKKELK